MFVCLHMCSASFHGNVLAVDWGDLFSGHVLPLVLGNQCRLLWPGRLSLHLLPCLSALWCVILGNFLNA